MHKMQGHYTETKFCYNQVNDQERDWITVVLCGSPKLTQVVTHVIDRDESRQTRKGRGERFGK